MNQKIDLFPCPCCGYLVHDEPPGSDLICRVCFWQDDIVQLRFPEMGGGANKASLIDAQKNFSSFGASEERVKKHVHPTGSEKRDAKWRPLNKDQDNIERPIRGTNYGSTYPKDRTALYYWRENYWRIVS